MLIYFIIIIIPVMVNVAFFTLFERKILGLSQLRKGPNKTSLSGVLQPFSDAVKLFLKEFNFPFMSMKLLFIVCPIISLFLVLVNWFIVPLKFSGVYFNFSVVFMLVVLSLGVYPVLFSGWSSNSKYALIGATRSVAQTISYEISMALVLLGFLIMNNSLTLVKLFGCQEKFALFITSFPFFYFWLLSSVAETNRSPFDFAEGESELVSGFNVEYGSGGFALIFLAEYASIMFLSMLAGMMLGVTSHGSLASLISMMVFIFFWVWLRSSYPRYRYDMLMNLAWKSILPLTLLMLLFWVFYV